MRIEYAPRRIAEVYLVASTRLLWYYPAWTERGGCFCQEAPGNYYGAPPSHELRTLIEANAPWFVILDKLIEEYPQWEPYFAAAAVRERLANTGETQ